jgi:hypothetical protein
MGTRKPTDIVILSTVISSIALMLKLHVTDKVSCWMITKPKWPVIILHSYRHVDKIINVWMGEIDHSGRAV